MIVHYNTRQEAAEQVVAGITEAGGTGEVVQADLATTGGVAFLTSWLKGKPVEVLVNNAGSSPGGVLEHLTEEDWAQSLQLKFMGYVRCMKHVLPIMQKQKKGRVVNLIGNDGVKVSYWEIAPGAANAAGQNLTISASPVWQ